MVPYKRIDLIVEAFSKMPEKKLVVIGDGPEMKNKEQGYRQYKIARLSIFSCFKRVYAERQGVCFCSGRGLWNNTCRSSSLRYPCYCLWEGWGLRNRSPTRCRGTDWHFLQGTEYCFFA